MQMTTKSSEVIRAIKSIFTRHGIPEQVQSGNGLTVQMENSLTLLRNGDLYIAKVVLDFPKQMEKLSGELELLKNLLTKKKRPC